MIKNSVIALITAAALAGVAAPAMAAPSLEGNGPDAGFDYQHKLTVLQQQGVNATSIEEWGDNVLRAYVVTDNGTQVMQFFDKDTLAPLAN